MTTKTIRIGNAPVSWGVYEADRENPPFSRVLDDIATAGYEGTELGPYGYLPTAADALAAELRARRPASSRGRGTKDEPRRSPRRFSSAARASGAVGR